jgi:hypothetical protein
VDISKTLSVMPYNTHHYRDWEYIINEQVNSELF